MYHKTTFYLIHTSDAVLNSSEAYSLATICIPVKPRYWLLPEYDEDNLDLYPDDYEVIYTGEMFKYGLREMSQREIVHTINKCFDIEFED